MDIIKRLAVGLIIIGVFLSLCACGNEDNSVGLSEDNTSSVVTDNNAQTSEDSKSNSEDVTASLISVEDYGKFFEEQFSLKEKWQLETVDRQRLLYRNGDSAYIEVESYSNDFNSTYLLGANGYAMGVENNGRVLEVDYSYGAEKSDLRVTVFSEIGLDLCVEYTLKIFENSSAKITTDEFFKEYNGGEKIDASKESEKEIIIKGVKYEVKIEPIYTLDGEQLSARYYIGASLVK